METKTPLRAIRENCLECCGGGHKVVKYCTCDGINGGWCPFWPYRFGMRPETAGKVHGREFIEPKSMPTASDLLDNLP